MPEKQFFSYEARFVQNTTKGIHSGYLVSKPVYILKCIGCKMEAFVDRCGARKFHSLHLHLEISSQPPPLSSELALPQTQKWLVAKYQYSSSRDWRQKTSRNAKIAVCCVLVWFPNPLTAGSGLGERGG